MKVFAYLRVSGKGQVDGYGFDRQLQTIKAYCDQNNHTIDKVFKEQVSGTASEADRPEFSEMVEAILRNGIDTIVVESLDRLAREYRIQEQLLIYLASKDIDLISANTGENITKAISEDPMKKAMIQIQGIFAELDKSLTVKKLRKAREQVRNQKGKCEGRKGYGDTSEGQEVLKEIKRLKRKRKGRPAVTYDEIAQRLNEQGFTTITGKPFTGNSVKMILYRQKG